MPTFFIILISVYLAGNIYIFIKGLRALPTCHSGIKVAAGILFWCGALSLFGSLLSRNVEMPSFISHTMYEIGTGWLIFTLYMVIFLLLTDILKRFYTPFRYGFPVSLLLTFILLGCGYYNYRHPKTNAVDITINKPYENNSQPIKIVAVSDIHLGYGTGKSALKKYVDMINEQKPDLILIGGDLIDNSVVPLYTEKMSEELSELIVLVIYCMVVREEAVAFLLTFIVNYLIYLVFETSFFAGYELNKKRQKKNKTKNETVA